MNDRKPGYIDFPRLQEARWSAARIAAECGVTVRTVERWRDAWRRANGITAVPTVPRPLSDRERAWRLIEDGCSLSEAARSVGVSPTTIAEWFPDAPRFTRQQAGHASVLARLEREVMSA